MRWQRRSAGFCVFRELCACALLTGSVTAAAGPVEIEAGLALGYDSNPAQRRDGPGLAFARYALNALGAIHSGESSFWHWSADAWYGDYEGANDNYRAGLRIDWLESLPRSAGQLGLSVDGVLYRDQLVPADERKEAAVALRYDRVLSPRADLGLSAELRWLSYRNPSRPWAGRPGSAALASGSPEGGRGNRGGPGARAVRRDDRLGALGLDATWYWSPAVSSTFSVGFARRDSEVPVEAYDQYDTGLDLLIRPVSRWRLGFGVGWQRRAYDRAPRGREREDERVSLGLSLQRELESGELSCRLTYLDNASSVTLKSFSQTVTQCGLAWRF